MKTKFLTFLSVFFAIGIQSTGAWSAKNCTLSAKNNTDQRTWRVNFEGNNFLYLKQKTGQNEESFFCGEYFGESDCPTGAQIYVNGDHFMNGKSTKKAMVYTCAATNLLNRTIDNYWMNEKILECSEDSRAKTYVGKYDGVYLYCTNCKVGSDYTLVTGYKFCTRKQKIAEGCKYKTSYGGVNHYASDSVIKDVSLEYTNINIGDKNVVKGDFRCNDSKWVLIKVKKCEDGYNVADDGLSCVEITTPTTAETTTTPSTSTTSTDDSKCTPNELDGLNASEGEKSGETCIATKCKDGAYWVVKNNQRQGWCVFPTHCNNKPNTKLNIINNDETDLQCVPIESGESATSEESATGEETAEEGAAEMEGDNVSTSGAPADTQTAEQDPCSASGGTPGDGGTCKCEEGKTWNDAQKQCVENASDAGTAITEEAPSGGNTDAENSDGQNGESVERDVAQEPQVDPAVECSENGGKWDAQSNQCITPEMQREIDRQKSQENVDKLKADADAAREREQSTENKLLGAAGIGATGIGGMMLAQSAAENAADDDAERAMRAYLATFRCDYGGGKTVRGGEQEIELPGGNELINLYSEYIALANDLKVRKEQLGLKPGIESEPILDGATSGLYDDIAVGKTGGAYTSLARALMDPKGADAAAWAAQRAETAKNLKTGAITAGVGAAGSLIANLAINEIGKKDGDGDDAKTNKYTSSLKTVTAGLRPESVRCPSGGRYPQCECGGNDVYNPNTNTCDKCTNGFYEWRGMCNCMGDDSDGKCIQDDEVDSDGFVSIDVIKLFKNNGTELTDNAKRAFDEWVNKSNRFDKCEMTINAYTDLVGDADKNKEISDKRAKAIDDYISLNKDMSIAYIYKYFSGPVGCTCGVGEVPSGQENNIEYSECVGKADDYVPMRFAPCRRVEIKIECDTDDDSISVLMDGLGVISGSVSRQ